MQTLRTNVIKAKVTQEAMWDAEYVQGQEETVVDLTSECNKLARLEYNRRHDKVAGIVHWSLCEKYGLPRSEQWYRHRAYD